MRTGRSRSARSTSCTARWAPLTALLALAVVACGSPQAPTVGEEGPSEEPSGDPTDAASDDEVAAPCDELEDQPYDPPAEEQPTPDPEVTTAEPVPDVEPLDQEPLDEEPLDEEPLDEGDERPDGDPADEPAPEAPQTVMDQVREWAMQEAPDHFGGVWLDPEQGGASVVGFTEDVDAYAEEVRDRFGEGWWVVRTDNAWTELRDLQPQINEREMGAGWTENGEPVPGAVSTSGMRETISRVTLGIVEPDDERLAELSARYGADRICFEILHTPTGEDAEAAPWEPADADALSPDTTTIDIVLNERGCASGRSAEDRVAEPDITYDDDAVTITARVVPPPGPQDCPSNPDTPATIELVEPLGDRELLDGSHEPPRTPDLSDER